MLVAAHGHVLRGHVVAASGAPVEATSPKRTCRRCKVQFVPADNHARACVYHTALFTGGEVGKYTGFVPVSPAYEHRSLHRGLVRFWDCCNALQEEAPGCCTGPHEAYEDT
jgi:hypothetical protein